MFAHTTEDVEVAHGDDEDGEDVVGQEHSKQEVTVGRLAGEVVNAARGPIPLNDVPWVGEDNRNMVYCVKIDNLKNKRRQGR